MVYKFVVLAAMFGAISPLGLAASHIELAQDDGGDLNPQPLPPIYEEEFS